MNNKGILQWIVAILFIVNLFLLYSLMFSHPQTEGGPKNYIIHKLHFDPHQTEQYELTIQQHRREIDESERRMNDTRNALYQQLQFKNNQPKIDSLLAVIAQQQQQAEQINYRHFLQIKQLCKPSQMEDFNHLTQEIAQLFSTKHKK